MADDMAVVTEPSLGLGIKLVAYIYGLYDHQGQQSGVEIQRSNDRKPCCIRAIKSQHHNIAPLQAASLAASPRAKTAILTVVRYQQEGPQYTNRLIGLFRIRFKFITNSTVSQTDHRTGTKKSNGHGKGEHR